MKEVLEMIEEYNKDGICIKRTVNGFELPADTEPSVQIFKNLHSVSQEFYMTKEEFNNKYPHY